MTAGKTASVFWGSTLQRSLGEGRTHHGLPIDMRFSGRRPWYQQPSLLYGELLNRATALREIYFTGGEPLISPEALEILNYLIDAGVAGQITVQINSNCTQVPERWLYALSKFQRVDFALSLDGVGDCYEYIRYPARWQPVSDNILTLKTLPNISMTAVPIVQAYNMLHLVDLCRYCDSVGIRFALMTHHGHRHLDPAAMPQTTRMLAAKHLRDYLDEECRSENAGTVKALIRSLETLPAFPESEVLRDFMLFTNDLDVGRTQSFRKTHPELLQMIEDDGFAWTDETRYAGQPDRKAVTPDNVPNPAVTLTSSPATPHLSGDAQALCDRGEQFYAQCDTADAAECFRQAIQTDPSCARAYNNLGVLLWRAGEQDAALEVLARAISIISDDRTSILNYAGLLIARRQRLFEAKSLLVDYMLKHPGDHEVSALFLEIDA